MKKSLTLRTSASAIWLPTLQHRWRPMGSSPWRYPEGSRRSGSRRSPAAQDYHHRNSCTTFECTLMQRTGAKGPLRKDHMDSRRQKPQNIVRIQEDVKAEQVTRFLRVWGGNSSWRCSKRMMPLGNVFTLPVLFGNGLKTDILKPGLSKTCRHKLLSRSIATIVTLILQSPESSTQHSLHLISETTFKETSQVSIESFGPL